MLITAAVLGHAEVVSVLITAGFDPDARSDFFNLNIPLLMATWDGTRQPGRERGVVAGESRECFAPLRGRGGGSGDAIQQLEFD